MCLNQQQNKLREKRPFSAIISMIMGPAECMNSAARLGELILDVDRLDMLVICLADLMSFSMLA